jgi:FlaA1/EpsC-like NDP-sugar epimerase
MGRGGEIFILKMGEPVRILDLARNLIRLSGYEPDREIKIVFTGLRPGEKLFEELHFEQEDIRATAHDKIGALDAGFVDFNQVKAWLDDLGRIVEKKNASALVGKLQEIVPEYKPSSEMLTLCEIDKTDMVSMYRHETARLVVADRAA